MGHDRGRDTEWVTIVEAHLSCDSYDHPHLEKESVFGRGQTI